jgi:hypothetical protein
MKNSFSSAGNAGGISRLNRKNKIPTALSYRNAAIPERAQISQNIRFFQNTRADREHAVQLPAGHARRAARMRAGSSGRSAAIKNPPF